MSMYIQRASSQYTDKLTLCYLKREGIGEKFCSSLQQRVFDYAEVDLSLGGGGGGSKPTESPSLQVLIYL